MLFPKKKIVAVVIYSGNWTEWSAIWSEIIHVIWKPHERAAQVQFEVTSMISDKTRHEVQLPFYYSYSEIAEFSHYQYCIDQVEKWKAKWKGIYILFCTRNRNDANKSKNGAILMMWFRTWMTLFRTDVI